jgi:phage gp16-like protein
MFTRLRVANGWAAKTFPDWREDDYRQVLKNFGAGLVDGKYSATTMSLENLNRALHYFKQKGFKLQSKHKPLQPGEWRKPRISKLNALWLLLADENEVNDRSQKAMESWCKHNVPAFTRLQWADSAALNKAIEMLKSYCKRCGINVS